MREYIVLSGNDIHDLTNGREVCLSLLDGKQVCLISEEIYKNNNSVSEEEWKKAISYLNNLIIEYASVGWPGQFGLHGVLVPLKKRYENGERTKELYNSIMECE